MCYTCTHPHCWFLSPCFWLQYIKNTLLLALALTIGIVHKSRASESSKTTTIHRKTGLQNQSLFKKYVKVSEETYTDIHGTQRMNPSELSGQTFPSHQNFPVMFEDKHIFNSTTIKAAVAHFINITAFKLFCLPCFMFHRNAALLHDFWFFLSSRTVQHKIKNKWNKHPLDQTVTRCQFSFKSNQI